MFHGAETSGKCADFERLGIDFPVGHIGALIVTHVHIDHVGRIPYLLAAEFRGPIDCSEPSVRLLPPVPEYVMVCVRNGGRSRMMLFRRSRSAVLPAVECAVRTISLLRRCFCLLSCYNSTVSIRLEL